MLLVERAYLAYFWVQSLAVGREAVKNGLGENGFLKKVLITIRVGETKESYEKKRTSIFSILRGAEPVLCDIVGKRVLGVGSTQKGLDWKQNGTNLKSRSPLILEDVQADATQLVDIGVVDLRQKTNLGCVHRVILRQEQLQLKKAA